MPDIGLNPPSSGNIHSFTGVATIAGIRFGYVVVSAEDANHTDVALPGGAAAVGVMSVVTDQMGPTGSVVGDTMSVRDAGDAEVYLDVGLSVNVDDILIALGASSAEPQTALIGTLHQCGSNSSRSYQRGARPWAPRVPHRGARAPQAIWRYSCHSLTKRRER